MVRLCLILAAVVLAGLTLAPAARGGWVEDKDGKTVIHVKLWDLPDPSRTDTATRADVAAVNEFVRRFPAIFAKTYRDKYKANPKRYGHHNWDDVQIELHRFSGITVMGIETDLLAIAGKVAPDVLYCNFRKSGSYLQQNFFYPIDKPEDGYLTGMTQEEIDFRIHPKIWPVIDRKGPNGERHVWAIPYGGAVGKVMWYRKDLFDAAGVPYPDNDWTWEDMLNAAKKITNPKDGIYGFLLTRYKHEAWHWVTFLWSAGAEAMVYDEETDEWRCTFDSREAAVALDFYTLISTELWHDSEGKRRRGYSSKDTPGAYETWDQGRIGMQFSYIGEKIFATINPDIVGMAPVPLGPTGMRAAELNSMMMGIFAGV
ncbi:MAG TPA: extracellular solute-binding protein, partial [Phycisphaerae bacterium]|nr:extracellular solute-binding protein [Phycisphaerae bacterium]